MVTPSSQAQDNLDLTTRQDYDNRTRLSSFDAEEDVMMWFTSQTYDLRFALLLIGAVGSVENFLCIATMLSFTKLRNMIPGLFLINQSFIDFSSSFMLMITYVYLVWHQDWWIMPFSWPRWTRNLFCGFFLTTVLPWGLNFVAAWNLVALNFERYMMIVHPIFHLRLTKRNFAAPIMAAVWALPLLDSVVWTCFSYEVYDETICLANYFTSQTLATVYSYEVLIFMHILPLALIVYMNIRMVTSLRGMRDNFKSNHHKRAERNLLKTLVLISFAFVGCWSLAMVSWLLITTGAVKAVKQTPVYASAGAALVFSNASINPLIYSINFREFRRGVGRLLDLGRCRPRTEEYSDRVLKNDGKPTDTSTTARNRDYTARQ